jgi:hypothetical protein
MNTRVAAKALSLAFKRLKKLSSERDEVAEKMAKLEESIQSSKKLARAQDLAMKLLLDEDALRELGEKTAQLSSQDLDVVEKAMSLDLVKKEASIGTSLSDKTSASAGDALIDMLVKWSNDRLNTGK